MRQLHNLFALGPSLLLWCLQVPLTNANIDPLNPHNAEMFPHSHIPQYLHRDQRQKSILSRWRDGLIKKIWSVPQMDCHMKGPKRPSRATPPSIVLSRYGGDVVLRFKIQTPDEAAALADAVDVLFLDVWEFTTGWADIRLSKDVVPSLLGLLPSSLRDAHTPLMHDLAQAIYESYPSLTFQDPSAPTYDDHRTFSSSLRPSTQTNLFFRNYQPLSVITPWMRLLQSLFPSHVRMLNIGLTYEGRDIPALRVGVHPTNSEKPSEKRKTIIVAGGSHAREWVSVSTVNYIAYTFITEYGKNKDMTELLEQFDWIFIPTMNPDGYTYTWESDRLWRKNRQQTSLRFCKGIDLDRAWGFEWDGQTSNSNPCSESFGGEEPFQAVESRRLANWAKNETENNNVTFSAFLDLHSYSQQVLYPFSYSCTETPPTIENLQECAIGLAKAIRLTKGSIYGVTSACEGSVIADSASDPLNPNKLNQKANNGKKDKSIWPQLESSGGSALDWFYHELRVAYSYQIKLRDTGSYGFLLPPSEIVPTGKEALAAVKYLGRFLLGNKGIEKGFGREREQGDGYGGGGVEKSRWREEGMERVVGMREEMEEEYREEGEEEMEVEDGEAETVVDGGLWELKR